MQATAFVYRHDVLCVPLAPSASLGFCVGAMKIRVKLWHSEATTRSLLERLASLRQDLVITPLQLFDLPDYLFFRSDAMRLMQTETRSKVQQGLAPVTVPNPQV
eukprot:4232767-Amphidinium_carterae.1